MRREVARALWDFLKCGLPELGCARLACDGCGRVMLLVFSCKRRGLCPSCEAKRAELFCRHVGGRVVAPVPHRQIVLSIPRVLRPPLQRHPRLLRELARCGAQAIEDVIRAVAPRDQVALIVVIQTWGSLLDGFHPHLHVVMADGSFDPLGRFRRLPPGWSDALLARFRERVFTLLIERRLLRPETAARLRRWRRSGLGRLRRPSRPRRR